MSAHVYQLPVRDVRPLEVVGTRPRPGGYDLLNRCRDGDSAAWEELVERYERLVFGVAVREGLSRDDAADVTQIVFEALFTSLDKIREDERVSSWLLVVARRQVWRIRNRRVREHPVPEVDPGAECAGAGVPGGDVDTSDKILDLYEAVGRLGDPCRELVTALYFDPSEPSYEEVAVRLGRPVGSIGPSRARCLERLRRILAEGKQS